MDTILKQVDDNCATECSELASSIFIDYYTPLIGEKQATYMAGLFLSEENITKEIARNTIFKIAYCDSNKAGFSEYYIDGDRLFLSKFYCHRDYRGIGIGKVIFEDVKDYARKNDLKKIYLTVNKGNSNTISIYHHLGFYQIDSVVSDIGNGYVMDDYILEYEVK